MSNRLTKIYTRTGDKGMTSLGDGTRVEKEAIRVEAYGTIDELNSLLGVLLAEDLPSDIHEQLFSVQHDLFDLGGELCIPGHTMINAQRVQELEQWLDVLNEELPPLENFILPGGNRPAALCHFARTVCRRAERQISQLMRTENINEQGFIYINRLSDLLFVMARTLARRDGQEEVLWQQKRRAA